MTTTIEPLTTIKWIEAWIEISMTWYTGFAAVWIFTILGVCLSFRFYRPVLVVPNIAALFVGLFFNTLAFGSIFAWLVATPMEERAKNYEELILIYVMGSFFIIFLLNIVFIGVSIQYHSFLERRFSATQKVRPRPNSSINSDDDVEKK